MRHSESIDYKESSEGKKGAPHTLIYLVPLALSIPISIPFRPVFLYSFTCFTNITSVLTQLATTSHAFIAHCLLFDNLSYFPFQLPTPASFFDCFAWKCAGFNWNTAIKRSPTSSTAPIMHVGQLPQQVTVCHTYSLIHCNSCSVLSLHSSSAYFRKNMGNDFSEGLDGRFSSSRKSTFATQSKNQFSFSEPQNGKPKCSFPDIL